MNAVTQNGERLEVTLDDGKKIDTDHIGTIYLRIISILNLCSCGSGYCSFYRFRQVRFRD